MHYPRRARTIAIVGDARLDQLAERFAEGVLERHPTVATFLGDRRYDDRLPDAGPTGRERERAALEELRRDLSSTPPSTLLGEDAISHHMLELAADFGLSSLRHELHHLAVDQMQGPQVSLAMLLNYHTLDTEKNARDLLSRYRAIPDYLREHVDNLREGMAQRRTSPRIACERVLGQLQALLDTPPADSPYGRHARKWVGALSDDLVGAVRDAVYPAFAAYRGFLESEYRPRGQPGLSSIPRGGETYAELVRQVTQSEMTPEQVHRIGVDELRAIHDEMRALGVRDVRERADALKSDPRNQFATREELLRASQRLYDRAFAGLPRLFGRLPVTACRVIPIETYREKDSVAAFYNPPAADGSRPGTYYVNTYRPETRPRYNLTALTVHESVPGHHLQIAIQSEAAGIPRFRRHRLGTQGALTAFTEGWGLYSERLGDEMGLYDTEEERFGMLSYQAWRAARLVVDTGIHALGWPRDRAIRFMLDEVGLPEGEVVNEVDRYISWPSQALAYKIGQRHIERLRRSARDARGAGFDVRAFHDELLRHGAIPLSTASLVIERWLNGAGPGR